MFAKTARQMSERGLAREGGQAISTLLKKKPRAKKMEITLGADGQERVEIPREALQLLRDALMKMGEGVTVQLQPVREELTTQEAADLLVGGRGRAAVDAGWETRTPAWSTSDSTTATAAAHRPSARGRTCAGRR